MKKITNLKLLTALLRGAVIVSGATCTLIGMLFCEDVYALFTVAALGTSVIVLVQDEI